MNRINKICDYMELDGTRIIKVCKTFIYDKPPINIILIKIIQIYTLILAGTWSEIKTKRQYKNEF